MDLPEHLSLAASRSYRPIPAWLRPDGEWVGGAILRELNTPVGVALFDTYRDLMLWLLLAPPHRSRAFGVDAHEPRTVELDTVAVPPELAPSLRTLSEIYRGTISGPDVSSACFGVAGWAELAGAHHTRLEYTQAAALAEPQNAAYSLSTAEHARSVGQFPRAESWFRRTIKLARVTEDHGIYVRGYLGLGTIYQRTGNGPAAKATIERALRNARRWRLRHLTGIAHHDLIEVFSDKGDLRRAYEHARAAEQHYDSPVYRARLAADVAVLWVRVGATQRAAAVFETILPHAPNEGIRAVWSAWLARSAAACGSVEKYEAARERVFVAVTRSGDPMRNAEAAIITAWSDLALGAWERAASAAALALREGSRIGAAEVVLAAERAMEDAAEKRYQDAQAGVIEPPALARLADGLAGTLQEAVRR